MIPCLCAGTRRAARLLTLLYDAELGKAGLSASQFELLSLLGFGERHGRGIADALALDTTTVSRNLKPLVAGGLVAARGSRDDARVVHYSLTPVGRRRLRQATRCWQRAQQAVMDRLGTGADRARQTLAALGNAAASGTVA